MLKLSQAVKKAGQMPRPLKTAESKAAIIAKLEALLNRRAERVRDIPEDEINAVVDEAVRHVRHNRV